MSTRAWRAAAGMARRARARRDERRRLRARPNGCAHRFEEAFWCDEIGTYALALDGDKRPCRVRSSNAGHAAVRRHRLRRSARAAVAEHADGPARSFSGWGIRTIASSEARYNPMSYHNGSVWPHDNALIALGFCRYGFRREAARIFEGLFDACALHRASQAARTVLRLPAPARAGADLLSRRLLAPGLVGGGAIEPVAVVSRDPLRSRGPDGGI